MYNAIRKRGEVMTVHERIKRVRKAKGLTLEDFGKKIGISKSSVSMLERGVNNPSDQTVLSICREWGVNEHWLRTGEGEMFLQKSKEQELGEFLGKIIRDEDDSLRKRLISALSRLDESDWAALAEMLRKMKNDPE